MFASLLYRTPPPSTMYSMLKDDNPLRLSSAARTIVSASGMVDLGVDVGVGVRTPVGMGVGAEVGVGVVVGTSVGVGIGVGASVGVGVGVGASVGAGLGVKVAVGSVTCVHPVRSAPNSSKNTSSLILSICLITSTMVDSTTALRVVCC